MLKQRLITSAILIPAALLILFLFPPRAFAVATGMVMLAGVWEWAGLMGIQQLVSRFYYVLAAFFISVVALFIPIPFILIVSFIWWLLAIGLIALYPRGSAFWSKGYLIRGAMGLLTLIPCWGAMNFIRSQIDGTYILLFLLLLIWGADSVAYFVGKRWGRHKFVPEVSPGKSIEGYAGASIFALTFALLISWVGQIPMDTWLWGSVLSLVTVWFSIVGDLSESMLKRQAGVKDSSQLLPGHGGLLDRIDSLTAAAPVFVLGALFFGM
jgi:phosphatidate cytidylyltransferase